MGLTKRICLRQRPHITDRLAIMYLGRIERPHQQEITTGRKCAYHILYGTKV